jgi:hypothetical protein
MSLATWAAICAPCSQSLAPTEIVSALATELRTEIEGMPASAAPATAVVKAEEERGS